MKFLLKTFLLFVLIVAGRFVRTSAPVAPATAKGPASAEALPFLVQHVSSNAGGIRQIPGTDPTAEATFTTSVE